MRLPEKSPASTTTTSAGAGPSALTRNRPSDASHHGAVPSKRTSASTTATSQRKMLPPRRTSRLLVLGGWSLIEMTRLQLLEQALHFGFVFGKQQRNARGWQLPASGGCGDRLAPELTIWHAVDQRLARVPPQIAQQPTRRFGIAGVDHQVLRLVGQCQADHQRSVRAAVQ